MKSMLLFRAVLLTIVSVCLPLFALAQAITFGPAANGFQLGISLAPIDSTNPVQGSGNGFINVPILMSLKNVGNSAVAAMQITQDFVPTVVDANGQALNIFNRCAGSASDVYSIHGVTPPPIASGQIMAKEFSLWCWADIRSGATYSVTVTAKVRARGDYSKAPIATVLSNAIIVKVP